MKFKAGDRVRVSAQERQGNSNWAREIGNCAGTIVGIGAPTRSWTHINVFWDAPLGSTMAHAPRELELIGGPQDVAAVCVDTVNLELAERTA